MIFTVEEGIRTKERQVELAKQGKSKTMNSYHIPNSNGGRAVDLYPFYSGKVQVNAPHNQWAKIAKAMKAAAEDPEDSGLYPSFIGRMVVIQS